MANYAYRLVNVFCQKKYMFSGNPLCVFEDARGMDEAVMQVIAQQFNLSETTFVLPSTQADARVRIFTPSFEMPFAGHPTLGTAHVIRAMRNGGDELALEMQAGVISVAAIGDDWTLEANAPKFRDVTASRADLAKMLGVEEKDIADMPRWVNTGSEQLLIPLTSVDAVRRCMPHGALMKQFAMNPSGEYKVYVWVEAAPGVIEARFFFPNLGGTIAEDFGTGSAAANLGGWMMAQNIPLPISRTIRQGDMLGRPSVIGLTVDNEKRIFVSGHVIEIGRGVVSI